MIAALACVGCALAAQQHASTGEPRVIAVEKSAYATVYVVDEGDRRFLRFDSASGDDQSEVSIAHPERVPMEYVRIAAAGLALATKRERALIIGAGGGAYPMLVRRALPQMRIDAVDIDPVVVKLAQKYFGVVADDHLAVHVADGSAFVNALPKTRTYDVILLDAYTGTGIPAHLTTPAFLAAVRAHTSAGGVVVANVALDDAQENARFIATFARAFTGCVSLKGHEGGNVILVGAPRAFGSADEVARTIASAQLTLPFTLAKEIDVISACTL